MLKQDPPVHSHSGLSDDNQSILALGDFNTLAVGVSFLQNPKCSLMPILPQMRDDIFNKGVTFCLEENKDGLGWMEVNFKVKACLEMD